MKRRHIKPFHEQFKDRIHMYLGTVVLHEDEYNRIMAEAQSRKHLKKTQQMPATIYNAKIVERGWGWELVLLANQERRFKQVIINVPVNMSWHDFVLAVRRADIKPQ